MKLIFFALLFIVFNIVQAKDSNLFELDKEQLNFLKNFSKKYSAPRTSGWSEIMINTYIELPGSIVLLNEDDLTYYEKKNLKNSLSEGMMLASGERGSGGGGGTLQCGSYMELEPTRYHIDFLNSLTDLQSLSALNLFLRSFSQAYNCRQIIHSVIDTMKPISLILSESLKDFAQAVFEGKSYLREIEDCGPTCQTVIDQSTSYWYKGEPTSQCHSPETFGFLKGYHNGKYHYSINKNLIEKLEPLQCSYGLIHEWMREFGIPSAGINTYFHSRHLQTREAETLGIFPDIRPLANSEVSAKTYQFLSAFNNFNFSFLSKNGVTPPQWDAKLISTFSQYLGTSYQERVEDMIQADAISESQRRNVLNIYRDYSLARLSREGLGKGDIVGRVNLLNGTSVRCGGTLISCGATDESNAISIAPSTSLKVSCTPLEFRSERFPTLDVDLFCEPK